MIKREEEHVLNLNIKRLDHFGIVAGTFDSLKLVEKIDELLGCDNQEKITWGQAIKGMTLNGFGFINQSLMLTPKFFENKSLDLLIGQDVKPEYFNRFKLGKSLDKIHEFGCEKFFNIIAMHACQEEKIDDHFYHYDTTAFSLSGNYDADSDTEEVFITYGHSKDHRPDLKQLVLEMIVSQDAGIPLLAKSWPGNESDTVIFRERVKELIEIFKNSGSSKCLVADSKLYCKETAQLLSKINFITRVPSSILLENELIEKTITEGLWESLNNENRLREFKINHYGIDQRWVVVQSEQAKKRTQKTIEKKVKKEEKETNKVLFHLQAQRFSCQHDAQKELEKIAKKLSYHRVASYEIVTHKRYEKRGKPANQTPELEYQIIASIEINKAAIQKYLDQNSCFVIATNENEKTLSAREIIAAYKQQDKVEKSFRFLKCPSFFASSLFLKKTERIQALLVVMVIALLVYSIAQRRLRNQLCLQNLTVPNQIKKPTTTPTLRWIFQCFQGIDCVLVTIDGEQKMIINGLDEFRIMIIKLLGQAVCRIYQIFDVEGSSM